jgi:alkyl sulfatase BDS1-like metallo-beta-lactamase superfamily hydrolase
LESLVRDEPANADYQNRLVEALVGAANLQRKKDENDKAIANYQRAVEVRQKMVDANPDDKSLADDLAKLKSSLEKIQPAGNADKATAEPAAESE